MSAAAATRAPGWFKRGYEGPREFERARLYERGTSQKNHRRHDDEVDYRPVKSRLVMGVQAGFFEPVAPPVPRFAIGFVVTGNLDGKPVSGRIARIIQPPFGETQYVFDFNGDIRTIPGNRLDDLIAHLQTAVAAPPTVAIAGTVDTQVSGAINLAPCSAIVLWQQKTPVKGA